MVRRAKFADGTPKPLPKPERNFFDKLKTLKQVSKGISPESRIRLLDYYIQEALTKGQLTEEQASGIYEKLREDKDKIKKQMEILKKLSQTLLQLRMELQYLIFLSTEKNYYPMRILYLKFLKTQKQCCCLILYGMIKF